MEPDQTETALKQLKDNGYRHHVPATSARTYGQRMCNAWKRSAHWLSCDVMVTDPLTGNIPIKTICAFTSGGSYESVGYTDTDLALAKGYERPVLIVSRASGAPVIANALSSDHSS